MTRIHPQFQVRPLLPAKTNAIAPRKTIGTGPKAAHQPWQVPPAALQRIRAIPRDASDRRQRAVRIFLESVLLRELGDSTVHDPAFAGLVDTVERQMQEDSQLAAMLQRAGELLLSA